MSNKKIVQVKGLTQGMRSDIEAGNHRIVMDEPHNMGGQDSGPDPLTSLLGTLVGCENAIANFVAKEIDFDLGKITFDVQGELDPKGLMGDPNVRPYFENVFVKASVETSESQERVDELKEKVDARCPVFTTLKAAGVEMKAEWTKAS